MTNDTKGKRAAKARSNRSNPADELAGGFEGVSSDFTGSDVDRRSSSFAGSDVDR